MRELEREQDQRHPVELGIGVRGEYGERLIIQREFLGGNADELAQARGENRKVGRHAVLFQLHPAGFPPQPGTEC